MEAEPEFGEIFKPDMNLRLIDFTNTAPPSIQLLASLFIVFIAAHLYAAFGADTNKTLPYIEGELLVKFRGGSRAEGARRAKTALRHSVKRSFDHVGWQQIKLSPGLTVEQALERYRKHRDVVAVEPNYIATLPESQPEVSVSVALPSLAGITLFPDDPRFPEQWGLSRIGAPAAWGMNTGSSNAVVAVLDSGINYYHQDLVESLWHNPGEIPGNGIDDDGNGYVDDVYGVNTFDNNGDPFDVDTNQHGTGIASIIGASGNNGIGITGVNWRVKIMAVKQSGTTGHSEFADAVEGMNYILSMKAQGQNICAINYSSGSNVEASQAFKDSIDAAGRAGIVFVGIAHNYGANIEEKPNWPASFDSPSIIAVAASTESDALTSFSSYGAIHVHLAAPGQNILMASSGIDGYKVSRGTSYAAPLVTGSVALLSSENPSASVAEIKAAILETTDVVPGLQGRTVTSGILNVEHALLQIRTNQPPVIISHPKSVAVSKGSTAHFSVNCFGSKTISYQWFRDGKPLEDQTNRTMAIAGVRSNGTVWVIARNLLGSIESEHAELKLAPLPIVAWGNRNFGQCDVPEDLTNVVSIAGGRYHSMALISGGTVRCWGDNSSKQCNVPSGLNSVKAISAGTFFSVALTSNGTVTAWGASPYGELNIPAGLTNIVGISAGQYHTVALTSSGTVVAWGDNTLQQCNVPVGLTDVKQISAGFSHSAALLSNGTVVCWGKNDFGQCNVPLGLNSVTAVVAGSYACLALQEDGHVIAWGGNDTGQLGVPAGLSDVVAIAGYGHFLALKRDGTVVSWGAGMTDSGVGLNWGQAIVPTGLSNVVAIASTGRHSLALVSLPRVPPVLTITTSGGTSLLSWPDGGEAWKLESAASLGDLNDWQVWPELPMLLDGTSSVLIPNMNTQQFFRLRLR